MGTLLLILLALYGTLVDTPAPKPKPKPAPKAVVKPESEGPVGAGSAATPGRLLVVGDSLAKATEAPLAQLLPEWQIETDATTGRHTGDGVAEIVSRSNLPGVIFVSLGTNDNPSATDTFASYVEQVLAAAGPSRCVVWANISRPPYAGVSYSGYNQVLDRLSYSHPNLTVVDWARIAHSQPGLLGSDGTHATSEGYAVRAQAIASAIASCGGVQAYGGTAGVPGD
jgi:lysophospholipase L1-like esterase